MELCSMLCASLDERGAWGEMDIYVCGWVPQNHNIVNQLCPVLCFVTQSCPTLRPMDSSLPGSSVYGDSPGKNTGVGCHTLLQGIFPTQGSTPGLPHCRWILYHLSHLGSPRILEWVTYSFSLTQESNWGFLHCRQILYQLNYQGSPGYTLIQNKKFKVGKKDFSRQLENFEYSLDDRWYKEIIEFARYDNGFAVL